MITEIEAIASIKLTIYVLIGWIIYFWGYRKFRGDLLRHKMLMLRSDLFVTTCRLKIPLDTPAYVTLRNALDKYLLYSHRMGICTILVGYLIAKKQGKEKSGFSDVLSEQSATLDNEEFKELVQSIESRMILALFWHFVAGAPILLPCLVLYIVYKVCAELAKTLYSWVIRISYSGILQLGHLVMLLEIKQSPKTDGKSILGTDG